MMSWSESLSTMTRGKAQAAGEISRRWLTELDGIIALLERDWRIEVTRALDGGSHAFVGEAVGQGGEAYVLKAELPDNPTEEFLRSAAALRLMDGKGYCRLYACDGVRRAALLERLGEPLSRSGLPPDAQMRIICAALRVGWDTPAPGLSRMRADTIGSGAIFPKLTGRCRLRAGGKSSIRRWKGCAAWNGEPIHRVG